MATTDCCQAYKQTFSPHAYTDGHCFEVDCICNYRGCLCNYRGCLCHLGQHDRSSAGVVGKHSGCRTRLPNAGLRKPRLPVIRTVCVPLPIGWVSCSCPPTLLGFTIECASTQPFFLIAFGCVVTATVGAAGGVLFTDSNGREMLTRRINWRPTWPLQVRLSLAGQNHMPSGFTAGLGGPVFRI